MGSVKLRYYVVKKGYGYFQPSKTMKDAGAKSIPCGKDGPAAWAAAEAAYRDWIARAIDPPREPPARRGTLRYAFQLYRETEQWSAVKAETTRQEWWRCWDLIGPAFGDCDPKKVTVRQIEAFRSLVHRNVSPREAHRCIKVWRAMWRVAVSLKVIPTDEADPALSVRNIEPKARSAVWTYDEARKIVKAAWRARYYGLAAVMSVAWDTSYSPVDVRTLTPLQRTLDGFTTERAKTGVKVVGILSRRSERILDAYLKSLGFEVAPSSPIFRNRSGAPYSKDTLGDDFRDVRVAAFGAEEKRTLADFRRSGTVEAMRGGATAEQIGQKLGNDFASNRKLQQTYAPTDAATVKQVEEARRRARRKA